MKTIGQKTFEGVVWTVGFTIFIKILTALTQLVLAWLLVPSDFGLLAMTLSITNIASIFAGGQIKTILIQNQEDLCSKFSQGFWIGLFLNLIIALILFSTAPIAAKIYSNDRIIDLISIVAFSIPIRALSIIYSAKLNIELRFKTLVKLHFMEALVLNLSTIILALLNFGVYALVIPFLISSTVTSIVVRLVVGKIKIDKPRISEWTFFINNFSLLVLYNLILSIQYDGINLLIGVIHGAEVTGLFFWGYNLAVQVIFILTLRLKDIFFPMFTKFKDQPENRYSVFRKILNYLILVSIPIFCLQFILAPSIILILFNERWYEAIEVIQWISLIILVKPFNVLLDAILLALGNNKLLILLTFVVTFIVISGAIIGGLIGTQASIAKWMAMALVATGISQGIFTYIFLDGKLLDLFRDLFPLLFILIVLFLFSWLIFMLSKNVNVSLAIIITIPLNIFLFIIIVKKYQPGFLEDIAKRIGHYKFFKKFKLVK